MFLKEIKNKLLKPPILHVPDVRGKFQIFSDICKTAPGSPLSQIQNGIPKIIGCANKSLPLPGANYSSSKLELLGLCINISQFNTYLLRWILTYS